jgi:imidazolonepropionase-like amidohydrolase
LSFFITGPDRFGYVEDVEGVREAVRFWVKRGFTSVKALTISGDRLEAIIDEAHKMGVKVTADLGHMMSSHREAIDFGIDQLEHVVALSEGTWDNRIPPNDKRAQQHMQHYIDNNVAVSMTMSEWDNVPAPESVLEMLNDRERPRVEKSRLGPAFMADSLIDGSFLKHNQEVALAFWHQGGTITLGTDAVFGDHIAGYSNLRAIELTVDAGIPNLEVIKMATHNGAESIGILDDRGTIEVGKRADLIVIKGDPSKNIKAIYNIETVFKKGIGYNPEALKDSVKGTVGGPG